MSSVVKPKFTLPNLHQALATYAGKKPSDSEVIKNFIEVTGCSSRANGNFESAKELIAAIHKAGIFPADSPLPQQIAEAFDWVIRRPVRTYSPQDLLDKLDSNFDSFASDLCQYLAENITKFFSFSFDQEKWPATLIEYVDLCLISPSVEYLSSCCNEDGILSMDQFNELEEHFKIFSGEGFKDPQARKNLLKFYLKSTIKEQIDFAFNIECFGHLVDPSNNDAPYLDLMSGIHPIRHISSFMSSAHDRQIILTDTSKAVKQLYEIVNELTDGEFFKRVKLLNEDIFNLQGHLKPNSIGTIRLSNVVTFMHNSFRDLDVKQCEQKIQGLLLVLFDLLKPGGKIVFCLRHLPDSQSQDISIGNLLNPSAVHRFINFELGFDNYAFFKLLYFQAKKLGYKIKVGHTDLEGNFIENKSGFKKDYTHRATELVLIKPGA